MFANQMVTLASIPSPASNVTVLMTIFTEKGFDNFTELVALSGRFSMLRPMIYNKL